MNPDEIQQAIYDTFDKLEMIVDEYAKARADKNYCDEFKKVALNLAKSASESTTVAGKEQDAYTSESYKKYLWKSFEIDTLFYQLDGRKSALEHKLDALRSLLSYNKDQINRAI